MLVMTLVSNKSSVRQSSFCCVFVLFIVTEKMRQFVLFLVPLLVLIDPVPALESTMTDGMRLVSQSSAFFTADIYGEIRSSEARKNQNLVFSPFSLSVLLAMLKIGSRNETEKEIKDGLRLSGLNDTVILQGYRGMIRSLQASPNVTLKTGNKIYMDDSFSMRATFLKDLTNYFNSEAQTINFAETSAGAKAINKWVADRTDNKITDMILPRDLNKDVKSMLVNVVYFKGKWANTFDPERTESKPFTTVDNRQVTAEFMKTEGPMQWGRIKELEIDAIAIPYAGGRLSLVALLPVNASGFADLEKKLRGYDLSSITQRLRETPVVLEIPKMKIESTLDLVDEGILQKIGIKSAFGKGDTRPDLSGMTENTEGLYVNSVVQKAYLEISEEGTTAAAAGQFATVVKILPQRFIANRPFIAYIFDSETKSILFVIRKTQ